MLHHISTDSSKIEVNDLIRKLFSYFSLPQEQLDSILLIVKKKTAPLGTRFETDGNFPLKKNSTHKVRRVNLSMKVILKLRNLRFFFEVSVSLLNQSDKYLQLGCEIVNRN